jgi:hypothetical protein
LGAIDPCLCNAPEPAEAYKTIQKARICAEIRPEKAEKKQKLL